MANSLAQYLADLQVQIKEAESRLVFGVVVSNDPLQIKYGEVTLEDNFLFVEDGVTLTVGQKVPMLKTNRSQVFIVMLSKEMTPQDILSAIKDVDGSGSGLDADLLDGKHASDFSMDDHSHTWDDVTGKPTTFPPEPHNQDWSTIDSKPTTATRWPTWSEVTSKPSTFAPSSHTHNEYAQAQYNGSYNYLGGGYISGGAEKPNWFGGGKLKLQMLRGGTNIGAPDTWNDCLWLSSYTGGDVSSSNLLIFSKYNDRIGFSRQNFDSTSWGTYREIYHTGNMPTTATRWPTWSEVTSKPTTATRWPTWSEVTSKPSTFSPSSHTHTTGTNSTSGYVKFDNGIKINWVQVTISASTRGKTFTWPSAFTSAVYATWATSKYYDMQGGVDGASKTGGTVNAGACSNGGTVGIAITWTAYGIGV